MGAQATCCARADRKDREAAEAAAKALCPKEDPDMTAADKVKVLRQSMRTSIRHARNDITLVGRAVAGLTGRHGRQPGRPSQRPLAQDTTRIYQVVPGVASGKSLAGQYEFKGQWHHSRRVYRRQDGAFFMYSWSTATGTEQDGWWVAVRVGAHQEAAPGAAAFNRQNAPDPPAEGWCVGTLANMAEDAAFSVKLLKGNPVNKAPRILAGKTGGGARPSLVVRFAAEVVKEDGEVVPLRGDPASARSAGKAGGDEDEASNFAIGDKVCWISFDDEIPQGSVGEIVGFTQDRVRARFGDEVFKFRADELTKASKGARNVSPTNSEDMERTPTDEAPKKKDERSRPGSPGKRPAAAGGVGSKSAKAARGGRGSAEPKQGAVLRANGGGAAGVGADDGDDGKVVKNLTMAQKEALWELLERVRREKMNEEQGASAIQAVWRRRQFLKEQQRLAAEQQGKAKVDFTLPEPEAPGTPSGARGRTESENTSRSDRSDPKKGTRANNASSSAGPEVGRGSASRDRKASDFTRSNSKGRGDKGGGDDPLSQWLVEGGGRSQRPPGAKAAANARSASASAALRRDRVSSRLAAPPVLLRASEGNNEVRLVVPPKSGRIDNGTASGRPKRDKAEDKDKKLKKEKTEKSDTARK